MPDLNRLFSILVRAGDSPGAYSRAVSGVYRPSGRRTAEAETLRLGSSDPAYWRFVADSVLELGLASPMADELLAADPVNTYAVRLPTPESSSEVYGLPQGVAASFEDFSTDRNWVSLYTEVSVNATLGTASLNGATHAYTTSGGLSCQIPVGSGTAMRLRGLESGSCDFELYLTRPPGLDLLGLRTALDSASPSWSTALARLRSSSDLGEWFGAWILDYCGTEGS